MNSDTTGRRAMATTSGLGHFGGIYAALHAGHTVGDYWVQTARCAKVKGEPGPEGSRACAVHVATLTATQAGFLYLAVRASGERLDARRALAGLIVNGVSHYVMDRRDHGVMPVLCRALRRFGEQEYAAGDGAPFLDQAWHIGFLAIAAAIISGKPGR